MLSQRRNFSKKRQLEQPSMRAQCPFYVLLFQPCRSFIQRCGRLVEIGFCRQFCFFKIGIRLRPRCRGGYGEARLQRITRWRLRPFLAARPNVFFPAPNLPLGPPYVKLFQYPRKIQFRAAIITGAWLNKCLHN